MALHLAAVFAFLLATLTAISVGLPIQQSIWQHSCGQAVRTDSNTYKHGGRHGITKILKVVKNQIGIAKNYFKSEKKNFNTLYHQARKFQTRWDQYELYQYEWLPQKQLDWYNNTTCSLEKSTKVKRSLQHFHSSLQNYSLTFEELKKFSPDSNGRIRNKFIGGIVRQLKQILCEVEWALQCLKQTIPAAASADFLSETKNWDTDPDTTGLLMQDWGVITLYEKFLKEWDLIVGMLNRKKCARVRTTAKGKTNSRKNRNS